MYVRAQSWSDGMGRNHKAATPAREVLRRTKHSEYLSRPVKAQKHLETHYTLTKSREWRRASFLSYLLRRFSEPEGLLLPVVIVEKR